MAFISRYTGKKISEQQHIAQSIEMILTTRIGTRVMRRNFGSRLMDLLDSELNPSGLTAIYAAVNEAIAIWEPRVEVIQTQIDINPNRVTQGVVRLRITLRIFGEIVEQSVTVTPLEPATPTIPETPLEPPVDPTPTGDPDFTTFLFGNNETLILGNDEIIGWDA